MAISAFFIHKRSVQHVLQRLIEIRRHRLMDAEEEEEDELIDAGNQGFGMEVDEEEESSILCYGIPSSDPNVNGGLSDDWVEGDDSPKIIGSLDKSNLPLLQLSRTHDPTKEDPLWDLLYMLLGVYHLVTYVGHHSCKLPIMKFVERR